MAAQRKKTENLSNRQRVNILATYHRLEGLYQRTPKYAEVDRELRRNGIVYQIKTIRKWVKRREELETTGVLQRKPNPN